MSLFLSSGSSLPCLSVEKSSVVHLRGGKRLTLDRQLTRDFNSASSCGSSFARLSGLCTIRCIDVGNDGELSSALPIVARHRRADFLEWMTQ